MKKLVINNNQEYLVDRVIKYGNNIKLFNTKQIDENGVLQEIGDLEFPNISNLNDFKLEDGCDWDIPFEDEKMLYDLDMDFRLSKIEMGL